MLLNQWYVFGASRELDANPLSKQICGLPVVVFRGAERAPAALINICPHRRAPLSLGDVTAAGTLRCRYHGMEFDAQGHCTHIPSQSVIPPRAHIRSLPVRERYGLVWIWPGEAELAQAQPLPELPWREDEAWNADVLQYFHVKSNHLLMNDNLLDLSHVAFLHADSIGFDPRLLSHDPLQIDVGDGQVISTRIFRGVEQAPAHRVWHRFPGKVDRIQIATWRPPSNISILVRNSDDQREVDLRADHFITPETATSHHYFIGLSRNFRIDDADLTAQLDRDTRRVHSEDVEIAEAQQAMAELAPDHRDMPLQADHAVQAAHRILRRMQEQESARGAA